MSTMSAFLGFVLVVSSDFYGALDDEVSDLLADAAQRADENDRKTVQERDL